MKTKITIKMLTIEGDADALPLVGQLLGALFGAPEPKPTVDSPGVSSKPRKRVQSVKQVPTENQPVKG